MRRPGGGAVKFSVGFPGAGCRAFAAAAAAIIILGIGFLGGGGGGGISSSSSSSSSIKADLKVGP